jgi:hypothetical protein
VRREANECWPMKYLIRHLTILLISVAIGALLAFASCVYPETIAEKSTWDGSDFSWHYQQSRCSLCDVVRQGFSYEPQICDARQVHTRNRTWRWNYLWITPLFVILTGSALLLVLFSLRRVPASLVFLWRCRRWAKGLSIYVFLSVIAHVLSLCTSACIMRLGRRGVGAIVCDLIVDPLEMLTLPCSLVNHAILYCLSNFNCFLLGHTSPALGSSSVYPYTEIFGGRLPSSFLWELFCVAVIVAFWVLVLPSMSKAAESIFRGRRITKKWPSG